MIQRNFPKTIISSHPFDEKFIEEKINNTNEFFGIDNGGELVHQITRSLLPYDTEKQPIYLLQKSGKVLKLDESEDQLLSGLIVHKTKRYILAFPRM
ncbi:hypothetical protein D3C87_1916590 [compost metagenome]